MSKILVGPTQAVVVRTGGEEEEIEIVERSSLAGFKGKSGGGCHGHLNPDTHRLRCHGSCGDDLNCTKNIESEGDIIIQWCECE